MVTSSYPAGVAVKNSVLPLVEPPGIRSRWPLCSAIFGSRQPMGLPSWFDPRFHVEDQLFFAVQAAFYVREPQFLRGSADSGYFIDAGAAELVADASSRAPRRGG